MAKIAIVHVKTRNEAITIGALVVQAELQANGYAVDICTYEQAHKYELVLVSMTSTWDIYEFYKSMKKAGWQNRKFKALLGGFGCQNPFALDDFIDWAFFGRAEGIITDVVEKILSGIDPDFPFISPLKNPRSTVARPVQYLSHFEIKYGKNCSTWKEEFTGCPFTCKFCHYTWNRKNVRPGDPNKYVNDGISTGSKEVMLMDVIDYEEKMGRVTAGLDGYSERLRFLYGKPITWDIMEGALDHMASFVGNSYMKIYNITNFPGETPEDEAEFIKFCKDYTASTSKKDGILSVEVFNTAFRPSINTPMERMPVSLFPEARRHNLQIASGSGIVIKYTHLIQGAWMHLADVIAIRYNYKKDKHIIDFIATNELFNKKSNGSKLEYFLANFEISEYVREYSWDEPFISDFVQTEKGGQIKRSARSLAKKINANVRLA
jgi:radical SAM superfamily enzyme YgiQ (UPF0313 family)